jgi:hypothetical protein
MHASGFIRQKVGLARQTATSHMLVGCSSGSWVGPLLCIFHKPRGYETLQPPLAGTSTAFHWPWLNDQTRQSGSWVVWLGQRSITFQHSHHIAVETPLHRAARGLGLGMLCHCFYSRWIPPPSPIFCLSSDKADLVTRYQSTSTYLGLF